MCTISHPLHVILLSHYSSLSLMRLSNQVNIHHYHEGPLENRHISISSGLYRSQYHIFRSSKLFIYGWNWELDRVGRPPMTNNKPGCQLKTGMIYFLKALEALNWSFRPSSLLELTNHFKLVGSDSSFKLLKV